MENVEENNIIEWLNCDANYLGFEHLSDEDIINSVKEQLKIRKSVKGKNLQYRLQVNLETALNHVNELLVYVEEQEMDYKETN